MPDTRTEDGSIAADISRRAVQILREYTGRGPTKARTVISKDTVAIVLADTLTKGERSLVGMGEEEHVLRTRRNYQELMRHDLVGLVEELSGQKVHAFFSDNHIEPDYAVEFFLLTPIPGTEAEQPPLGAEAEQPPV
jgi:uncharacterized protein YbcI